MPAGTTATDEWWENERGRDYRIIGTDWTDVDIDGQAVACVRMSALQFADGTVDAGEVEAPAIFVEGGPDWGITSAQARLLAARIIAAADQIDGWVTR